MIDIKNLYWAAGFIEGEASFHHPGTKGSIGMAVEQVSVWPLHKLQELFGGSVLPVKRKILRKQDRSPLWVWRVYGARAAGAMMTLYSLLSPKRKEKAKKILIEWRAQKYKFGIPKIKPNPLERIKWKN